MPSQAEVIQALRNASNGQDMAVPPPQSPADVVAGAAPFANALGLPDALKALKGQLTPEEGQAFALTSAMGLLPGAKAETAVAKGAASLAGKGTLTDMGKAAWQAAKANDFAPVTKVPYALKKMGNAGDEGMFAVHGPSGKIAEITSTGVPNQWHLSMDNLPFSKYVSDPLQGLDEAAALHQKIESDPGSVTPAVLAKEHGMIYPPIDDNAISSALAKNPGASIFDVAGTNIEGPSTPYSPHPLTSSMLKSKGYGPVDWQTIPREGGVQATPLAASILGRSENLVHGTSINLNRWLTPEGGGDALALPEDELGVHFGNPKQSAVFNTGGIYPDNAPRSYPVVVQTNKPLRMNDLGSWHEDRILNELHKINDGKRDPGDAGMFPRNEVNDLDGMPAIRKYLNDKGYDSVVYQNSEEDPGHDSFIKFTPSPEEPKFVTGVRSPFAAFDPSKIMRPELAAGIGGAAALSPQGQEYIQALQNGGQQNQ